MNPLGLSPDQLEARKHGFRGVKSQTLDGIVERLWAKIQPEPNGGCWLWDGATLRGGYGAFGVPGIGRLAHRVSYILYRGPIPDGLQLDHLCRVRCCVNPWHLEPVTLAENLRRGNGSKPNATCQKGHPLTDPIVERDGKRRCRICRRASREAYIERSRR